MAKHDPKQDQDPPAATLVLVVALVVATGSERTTDCDRRQAAPDEPIPPVHASPAKNALRAALATAAAVALVTAGLATAGELLAAVWGGIFLAVADAILRSLQPPGPPSGGGG